MIRGAADVAPHSAFFLMGGTRVWRRFAVTHSNLFVYSLVR
jgi:hypothetical protein